MVQKVAKRKTLTYALVAALLAIMLVAVIYAASGPASNAPSSNVQPLKAFSSLAELKSFLVANAKSTGSFSGEPLDSQYYGNAGTSSPSGSGLAVPAAASTSGTYSENQPSSSYSTTNVQVAGVDEADTVKTDGQYIYVISQDYSLIVPKQRLHCEREPAGRRRWLGRFLWGTILLWRACT